MWLIVNDLHVHNYVITITCDVMIKAYSVLVLQEGDTPLHNAACRGHNKVVQVLYEAGAKVDVTNHVSWVTTL